MTGKQRREQLIEVGRKLFADKGFEGTSVEEIAAKASVSKPVVYEHFGGKEGLYAVVVDREIAALLGGITGALSAELGSRETLERAAGALLDYIESNTDGFRILVRDSPAGQSTGSFASLISDVASQVEHILAAEFKRRKLDPKTAPLYAQMLVGMVALTGQWWLDSRQDEEGGRGRAPGQPRLERPGQPGEEARPLGRPLDRRRRRAVPHGEDPPEREDDAHRRARVCRAQSRVVLLAGTRRAPPGRSGSGAPGADPCRRPTPGRGWPERPRGSRTCW